MTKKAEAKKDPGVDEQPVPEPVTEAPMVVEPVPIKPADLTGKVNGLWPGNPPHRSGNFYFDLKRLELEPGQIGLIGSLADNFVFERVDVHLIREADSDICLEVLADYPDDPANLDTFMVPSNSKHVSRGMNGDALQAEKVEAGTFLGRKRAYLRFHNAPPTTGRMVINFVGYLIEPWR